jgi:hypothetical protein
MEGVKLFDWNEKDWRRAQELAMLVTLDDGINLWEKVKDLDSVWALHEIERALVDIRSDDWSL